MKKTLRNLLLLFFLSSALQAEKPNIVYIIADDLGYGDLSSYGQQHFQTPHIDALGEEGLRFTEHYAGNTVCAPSRSTLMTGQDTGNTYLRGNGPFHLREQDLTVAEILKKAGYKTGMVGKSCVTGDVKDPQIPHNCGFDYFYGTLDHRTGHWHYPNQVFSQGKPVKIEGNNGKTGNVYIEDVFTERSLEFIEQNKDSPFFLLLSFSVPHASLQAPQESIDPFIGKLEGDLSYEGGHYLAVEHVKATHAAMVTRMDQHVGQVVAKLEELGLTENTMISFTSDNGSHFEGGYKPEYLNSNGTLRGGKRDLYEGGIRVPFLVKWPAVIKPGRTTKHASAFWDFLPTVCEISGEPIPENIQGLSYLPLLKGEEQKKHEYLYWEFQERGGRVALRKDNWKLVRYDVNKPEKSSTYQLYNLNKDLSEKWNVAKKFPEKVKELRTLLKSARVTSPVEKWNFKGEL